MKRDRGICSIDGCEKSVYGRGWCSMHHKRWRVHGDTSICTTNRYIPMLERYWMKVQKGPGCWPWIGGGRDGYGTFTEHLGGKTHLAHRFAYEQIIGPIPDGLELDHRCRNTICVNPEHLRPTTHKQNREHVAGAQRNSSTGALGVYRMTNPSGDIRYRAVTRHNKKTYYNGTHRTIEEAAEAVRQLRLSLFTHNDVDRKVS